jgi:nicotinamidase-related amidase
LDYIAPDFRSAALITIDTQVDMLDGEPLETPATSEAVPKIATLAAAFRDWGRPIVHIVRLSRS